MVDAVNPATSNLVALALDAANLRQLTHANNIAMAGSPGYRPVAVEFETQLGAVREAIGRGALGVSDLEGVKARQSDVISTQPGRSVQGAVQLDQEVAAISRNALHYQALVKLLNTHYTTITLATDGGRR
jgi:flagellar basal-body rod protein FlgB